MIYLVMRDELRIYGIKYKVLFTTLDRELAYKTLEKWKEYEKEQLQRVMFDGCYSYWIDEIPLEKEIDYLMAYYEE